MALLIEDMVVWDQPEIIILGGRTIRQLPMSVEVIYEGTKGCRCYAYGAELSPEFCDRKNFWTESTGG